MSTASAANPTPAAAAASAAPKPGRAHPLRNPRILVPFLALLFAVNLPFLHQWFRGAPEVTQAVPFKDSFERKELGNDWFSNGGDWRIVDGQLYSPGVGNNPLWLKARLPADVRISFDVRSEGKDGDVKCEAFADGRTHSTGYLFLFGAWSNRENRLAKLDEHGFTTEELRAQLAQLARPYPTRATGVEGLIDSIRQPIAAWQARRDLDKLAAGAYYRTETPLVVKRNDPKVVRGQTYHWVITKKKGAVRWEVDGALLLELNDPAPLSGSGHDRFGFSSWSNDTWFDNLAIEAL